MTKDVPLGPSLATVQLPHYKLPLVLFFTVSSSVVLTSRREHGYLIEHSHFRSSLQCARTCAQKHTAYLTSREVSPLKRSTKLFVLTVITPTETAHSSFRVLV